MSLRHPWRWCAVAGVVAFLCSWGFGRIPGLVACGPSGGLGPIIAFEFVRSPADVMQLFGSEPCRSTLVAAQKAGLLLDGLGFIPAYTAFLVLAVLGCAPANAGARLRPPRSWAPAFAGEKPWTTVAVVGLIAAGLADEIEGGLLDAILGNLPGTQATINVLWWAVHIKFALLALGSAAIGTLMMRTRSVVRLLGAVVLVAALIALYSLGHMPNKTMMLGFTIAWVTILLAAFAASIWPSLFSAPATPPPAPASPSA